MKQKKAEGGFTLIEVILFLAIAGLMFSGVMIGVSGSINRQRYDDAVISLQDYLQGQYNLVDNVRNNRPEDRPCSAPGGVALNGSQARGSSECAVVGRFVSSDDGREITSKPVFAVGSNYVTDSTEAALLNSLALEVAPLSLSSDDDNFDVRWGTKIYTNPASKDNSNRFSLLILRLPTNGLIRTYTSTTTVTGLGSLWASAPTDIPLCLESQGLTASGPEAGIRVRAAATSSAGIQLIAPREGAC